MQVLKITGLALVALSAVLTGFSMALRLVQRVKALESAIGILEATAGELEYSLAPLDEIMFRLLERGDTEQTPYIAVCDALCKKGMPFPGAWKQAIQQARGNLSLEDGHLLAGISQVLGRCSLEEALASIRRTQGLLETALVEARKEAGERGKLYRTLGMLSGAFLVILWM